MPLIMAFRRWWAIVFVAVLTLPTIGLFTPDMPAPMRTQLEPEARWWEHASQRLDPYINNFFGFRGAVLAAHRQYLRFIREPTGGRVLEGTDGSLFLRNDGALEQSIGRLVRPQAIERLVILGHELQDLVAPWGGKLIMTLPPNAHTARFDVLPEYARRQRLEPNEYDIIDGRMKEDGITFVDLRPVVAEVAKTGPAYYRYDTHWNQRSGLAAFNAVMDAAGRPDLDIAEKDALGPPERVTTRDLLRLANIESRDPPDVQFGWKPPVGGPHKLEPLKGVIDEEKARNFGFDAYATGHEGPRIMVIGDSFTQSFWRNPMAYRSSAFVWLHHQGCTFDRGAIERFKPDILIYAPTERFLTCYDWTRTPLRNTAGEPARSRTRTPSEAPSDPAAVPQAPPAGVMPAPSTRPGG
ncbi:hypothetical protein MWN33_00620 [Starkeya koreensis]|uniref:AlgX/AlgJ SGNH hydrolase-like domain-containing protein n=1 Tax=Ancylobacter koreensis TaxID=266121 RepID=A0ABT0DGY4_9HYPH|nr:hypothetical protein [Ancylobacter koreensis]MCK0206533.1 hypothetical protein [Ancylobacter koreensis]